MINESSLTRVWQHTKGDRPFAIITAFRGGKNNYETNVRKNRGLANNFRQLGYGFFYLDGYWIENQGTSDEEHVSEDSLFVIGDEGDDAIFVKQMVKFTKHFEQEGVLIKTSDGVHVYDSNGDVMFDVGSLQPNKLGAAYSKLRQDGRTFMFESERDPLGWSAHLVMAAKKRNQK